MDTNLAEIVKKLNIEELPEVLENPYHPDNHEFNENQKIMQQALMAQQRMMKPLHVSIIKMHFAGHKQVKIAEELNITPNTVSKTIHSPKGEQLLAMLRHYQTAQDGPSLAHRKAILYRIIVDNAKKAPKTAIQAVAELNKMDMNEHQKDLGLAGTGGGTVNITINQTHFPRTELDG